MRTAILTIAVLLALPAAAFADDPLLSGYGGPGAGEQAVVAGGLDSGDGGSGASGASGVGRRALGVGGGGAPAAGQSSAPSTASSGEPQSAASGNKHSPDTQPNAQSPTPNAQNPTPDARRPTPLSTAQLAKINRGQSSSAGFPLTGGEIAVALVALVLLALTALGLRSLARERRREATRDFLRSRQAAS